eukprot:m.482678 g.482678  ORF g.482678 m.482678 type:complete len:133 (+) comp22630_c0_seq1:290-688(+)
MAVFRCVLVLVAIAAVASAKAHKPDPTARDMMPFEKVDTNKDGRASHQELEEFMLKNTALLDGLLGKGREAEKEAVINKLKRTAATLFKHADKDKDNHLSKKEYDASIDKASKKFMEVLQTEVMALLMKKEL